MTSPDLKGAQEMYILSQEALAHRKIRAFISEDQGEILWDH